MKAQTRLDAPLEVSATSYLIYALVARMCVPIERVGLSVSSVTSKDYGASNNISVGVAKIVRNK